MLKRLLYLYNDGHNPFPKLGKGGLGYHLPQYRKRMRGDGMHLINGQYEYDDDDYDLQVYDQGFITGNYVPLGNDEFLVDDERQHNNRIINPKHIGKPEYFDTTLNVNDLNDDNDENDYYDPTKSSIPYLNTTQKMLYDIKNKKISKSDLKDVNDIINKTETLLEDKDKVRIEKTIKDLFMNNYGYGMIDKVYEGLKELMKKISKDSLEYKLYNIIKDEIGKSYLPSDISSLKNRIESKSSEDMTTLESTLKDIFKKHDEKMEETKVLIDSITNLPFEEKIDRVIDNYDNILLYYKTENPDPGKGFEDFLYKGVGKSIIELQTNDKSKVINNEHNLLIHEDLRLFSTVDLFNDTTVIECKDYWFTNSTEDIVLQDTKILSDDNGELHFNSKGQIVAYKMFDYQDEDANTYYKNVMPGEPRNYKVYFNLADGLFEYNISEIIKDYAKSRNIGPDNIFKFDENDIRSNIFGISKKDGTRIKDYTGKHTGFIIKKDPRYFKRIY